MRIYNAKIHILWLPLSYEYDMFLQSTTPEMAPPSVIWTIVGISIAFFLFSQWFQHKFKIDRESAMAMQLKQQELQERMKAARASGNQEELMRVNEELMVNMKDVYRKQMIPMCIRSVIWFALWGILRLAFGGYESYLPFNFLFGRELISLYLLVSFSMTFLLMGYKFLKKKLNPEKEEKEDKFVYDHIGALNNSYTLTSESEPSTTQEPSYNQPPPSKSSGASWKDRIDD